MTSATYDHVFDLTLATSYNKPAFITAQLDAVFDDIWALLAGGLGEAERARDHDEGAELGDGERQRGHL